MPALAVICDVLKIPDDVAGATLMAAGACSPEVVSSFIALFVTHSALGVGSVVGSEIFNHLCILGFLRQGRRPRTGQGHRRAGDLILRPRPGAAALRFDARARRGQSHRDPLVGGTGARRRLRAVRSRRREVRFHIGEARGRASTTRRAAASRRSRRPAAGARPPVVVDLRRRARREFFDARAVRRNRRLVWPRADGRDGAVAGRVAGGRDLPGRRAARRAAPDQVAPARDDHRRAHGPRIGQGPGAGRVPRVRRVARGPLARDGLVLRDAGRAPRPAGFGRRPHAVGDRDLAPKPLRVD